MCVANEWFFNRPFTLGSSTTMRSSFFASIVVVSWMRLRLALVMSAWTFWTRWFAWRHRFDGATPWRGPRRREATRCALDSLA
jgi:hypothetical protein